MLSANHILQHRITICPEAKYDKGFSEHRMLRAKGENLQRQIWPVGLSREVLKLLIHHRLITHAAFQHRFIEHD
jgi:hypothetical protein